MPPENYAVVVGINRYPGITELKGSENDAKWFHSWLISNELVPKANVALILGPDPPAGNQEACHATPDTVTVDCAFETLLRIGIKKEKIGKRLYLFFSGHGIGPTINDASLLMANCDTGAGITGHYINAVRYADFFATSAFFDEIVLFMDCCRDDLVRAPDRIPPWQQIRRVDGGNVKRLYGLATRWAQKAREAPIGPNGPVHGYYTRALRAALEGGAADKRGRITTSNLIAFTTNYIQAEVKPELAQLNLEPPEPQFAQKDDFVIATGIHPILSEVEITFREASQARKHQFVLIGGDSPFVSNKKGADPWKHSLPFGHYRVLNPDEETVAEFDAFGGKLQSLRV